MSLDDLALSTPVQVCREGKADRDRLAAANALLDRGFGKPAQQIDVLTVEKRLSELTNDEFAALEARLMLSAADARLVFGWRQTARKPDPSGEVKSNQGPGPREGSQQLTLESNDDHSGSSAQWFCSEVG